MPITKGSKQLVKEVSLKIHTLSLDQATKKHGDLLHTGTGWPSAQERIKLTSDPTADRAEAR